APADGRRLRRQIRSAQRVQHVPRPARLFQRGSRALRTRHARVAAAGGRAIPARHPSRRDERGPARTRRSRRRGFLAGGGVVSSTAGPRDVTKAASVSVDRSTLPPLRPVPPFDFPTVEKSVLFNGLKI